MNELVAVEESLIQDVQDLIEDEEARDFRFFRLMLHDTDLFLPGTGGLGAPRLRFLQDLHRVHRAPEQGIRVRTGRPLLLLRHPEGEAVAMLREQHEHARDLLQCTDLAGQPVLQELAEHHRHTVARSPHRGPNRRRRLSFSITVVDFDHDSTELPSCSPSAVSCMHS